MQALTPALDQWRQRILGLTARFEAVKESQPPQLQAAAQQLAVAAENMQAAAEQQVSPGSVTCARREHIQNMPIF